jgi:hypothetical protein
VIEKEISQRYLEERGAAKETDGEGPNTRRASAEIESCYGLMR